MKIRVLKLQNLMQPMRQFDVRITAQLAKDSSGFGGFVAEAVEFAKKGGALNFCHDGLGLNFCRLHDGDFFRARNGHLER